eukprot:Skav221066  [mRNA]  locus=scaffold3118:246337:247259:- [translate_table: standard]
MASQDQVIGLVASECNNFVENFFSENCPTFGGLETPDVMKAEQKAEWFNLYQKFEAEAELTMQNALMLWGLVQAKTFEEQFVEEATHSQALDDFLSLTDYPAFVKRMHREMQIQKVEANLPGADCGRHSRISSKESTCSSRPETHWSDEATTGRLAELDQRLAALEAERNALLVERRALVGRHVRPATSQTLRQQIQLQRYKEDVGMD